MGLLQKWVDLTSSAMNKQLITNYFSLLKAVHLMDPSFVKDN